MALWGGRFTGAADERFKRFNDSLRFDCRMVEEDIVGSIGWSKAIRDVGILTPDEQARLEQALNELLSEVRADPEIVAASGEEDVHSFVESSLIRKVGDLGKKLHTGRSRNDQVATDIKLWCRGEIDLLKKSVTELERALVSAARRFQDVVFPGYTHLQRAQPVTFSHWAIAYAEMFDRDYLRLCSTQKLLNRCPLGSAALAGTAYPVDREKLAKDLGFDEATRNSLDSVSDRDHIMELLSDASISMVHLSRFAEDLIFYNSGECGFVELSDAVTSGSSLMPQKKNPDSLELIRGKTGRVIGHLTAMLVTAKALPLAYDKDLQEDKEGLFDAVDTWHASLDMAALVLKDIRIRTDRAETAAKGGYSNATELADYLVKKGVPFREAHGLVGRMVVYAISQNKPLEDMSVEEFRQISPAVSDDVYGILTLDSVRAKRSAKGGISRERVEEEISFLEKRLAERG